MLKTSFSHSSRSHSTSPTVAWTALRGTSVGGHGCFAEVFLPDNVAMTIVHGEVDDDKQAISEPSLVSLQVSVFLGLELERSLEAHDANAASGWLQVSDAACCRWWARKRAHGDG